MPKLNRLCPCGNPLKKGAKTYCSFACAGKASRKKAIFNCEVCSSKVEIHPSKLASTNARFCSTQCAGIAKRKSSSWIEQTCYCGNTFTVHHSKVAAGRGKYCSPDCGHKAKKQGEQKYCQQCGSVFYASVADIRKARKRNADIKFCSRDCFHASVATSVEKYFCLYCGIQFESMARLNQKYCSLDCSLNDHKAFMSEMGKQLSTDPILVAKRIAESKAVIQENLIYTPELLKHMLGWKEATCSFPGCGELKTNTSKYGIYNACSLHTRRLAAILVYQNNERLKVLEEFGFEPI